MASETEETLLRSRELRTRLVVHLLACHERGERNENRHTEAAAPAARTSGHDNAETSRSSSSFRFRSCFNRQKRTQVVDRSNRRTFTGNLPRGERLTESADGLDRRKKDIDFAFLWIKHELGTMQQQSQQIILDMVALLKSIREVGHSYRQERLLFSEEDDSVSDMECA